MPYQLGRAIFTPKEKDDIIDIRWDTSRYGKRKKRKYGTLNEEAIKELKECIETGFNLVRDEGKWTALHECYNDIPLEFKHSCTYAVRFNYLIARIAEKYNLDMRYIKAPYTVPRGAYDYFKSKGWDML